LAVLQSKELSRIPYRPVFALFAEQPPGRRPEVWRRADIGSSASVPRLILLYPHDGLSSFAETRSRQKGRPCSLILGVIRRRPEVRRGCESSVPPRGVPNPSPH